MNFKIIPYTRIDGVPTFKDSELIQLYQRIYAEGLGDYLFHDGSILTAAGFVDVVTSPNILFYLIIAEDTGKPAGLFWCNRLEWTHCYCHFTCFRAFSSKEKISMGRMAMDHLLSIKDDSGNPMFYTIMGLLPASNIAARTYLHKVGLRDVGKVPNIIWSAKEKKPVDGFVMYITREDLKDENLQ